MATTKPQKLELTWIGKGDEPKLEPRILIENPEYSYGDRHTENMLIHGDNLLALKALEQDFSGRIKCIYIDPPYNTGSAFLHYDDGIEHSLWLSLMKSRLEILHRLLASDGLIFVQIDYRESARLKLLLDEIFGLSCFKNEIIVGRGTKNVQSQFETIDALSAGHDSIYLYAKTSSTRVPKLLARSEEQAPGKWDTFWRGTDRPTMRYEILGNIPPKGQWRWSKDRGLQAVKNYETYLDKFSDKLTLDEYYNLNLENEIDLDFVRAGQDGTIQYYVSPRNYKLLSDVWLDVRTIGKITDFPHEKHEALLERIIGWVTKAGDFVLDSFLGSGSTATTAHKMGRNYVGIELGEHAKTYCFPRLKAVVEGEQGGVSKAVNWQGGGGFKFYTLAPSLLKKDDFGNYVIEPAYNADMLAAAVAKQEGFKYEPDSNIYWKQGRSSEKDFIYTTTQFITPAQLTALHDAMQPDENLLITCTNFKKECLHKYPNISIKKIPQMLMGRCEFGKEDYSLSIVNMPVDETDQSDELDQLEQPPAKTEKKTSKKKKEADDQAELF
jgi:adenine-specific DNA-methyltransferase